MNKAIWIDLDNSPHVPFFIPIINELNKRGHSVRITSRDCSQTCKLADLNNLKYDKIGRHYGKNKALKVAGTVFRAFQLTRSFSHKEKPALALSHGSRAQTLSALLLGLPSMVIIDYEHVTGFIRPTWVVMPEVISGDSIQINPKRLLRYHGIKEDVYVPLFKPDPLFRERFQFKEKDIVVTIRPPATEAHYHNAESEALFIAAVNRIKHYTRARMIILPRYESQKGMIISSWPDQVKARKIVIPDQVVDGLNLLWHSDLVISGGGTMNREAASLGVPVYSIFRGKIGAVDRWLEEKGRLVLIESIEDVHQKIRINTRARNSLPQNGISGALADIIDHIENVINAAS